MIGQYGDWYSTLTAPFTVAYNYATGTRTARAVSEGTDEYTLAIQQQQAQEAYTRAQIAAAQARSAAAQTAQRQPQTAEGDWPATGWADDTYPQLPVEEEKPKTWLPFAIGGGALVAMILLAALTRRRT